MSVWRTFAVLIASTLISVAHAAALPAIHADGTRLVDDQNHPVILKGCNLGNWLVMEMWMAHWDGVRDQYEAEKLLTERFGAQQKDAWLDQYREAFMQDRDWNLIKAFGMNVVRLPVHYNLVLEDAPPSALRRDAFQWIDRALDAAEKHGLYVIIDLHAAPGSQSVDHNSGRSGFNRLWSEQQYQIAFETFWRETAKRYANRSVVAAYDILNEPYGNYRDEMTKPMLDLADKAYRAIRESDSNHVIFLPAILSPGLSIYDTPAVRSWKQIGFTEHEYPGLFGSEGSVQAMSNYLYRSLPNLAQFVASMDRPMFIGEFNPVMFSNGGIYTMRLQYDEFARYGWASTMWSYKILKPQPGVGGDNWYMVTNAVPLPSLNLKTSTKDQFDAYFKAIGEVPLQRDEQLYLALTSPQPLLALERPPTLPQQTPTDNTPSPWTSTDIATGRPGASVFTGDQVQLVAAGRDIYGNNDSFHFTARPVSGPFQLTATLSDLLDSDRYAKAGLMLRSGTSPDAPHATIHAFPDGSLAFCYREQPAGATREFKAHVGLLPVKLRLESDGKVVSGYYLSETGQWELLRQAALPLSPQSVAGLALASHHDNVLTSATFRDVRFNEGTATTPDSTPLAQPSSPNLLQNPSFEDTGQSNDTAAGWNRWGDWLNREDSWEPTHSGKSMLGYHHWELTNAGNSGWWQDVKVQKGQRYTFSIYASSDPAENPAKSIEVSLEATVDGRQMELGRRSYPIAELAVKGKWSKLVISGTALGDTIRVLVRINPSDKPPRGGAIRLDDASLTLTAPR